MKISRLGHAAVLIEGSKTVLIDPFIKDNPLASISVDDLPQIDVVVVTHNHFDHFGDSIEVAKKFGSQLIAVHEISQREDVQAAGIDAVGMNIGGTYKISEEVQISLTPAVHSVDAGDAAGAIIKIDGKTVYHAGDTALFSDMKLIPELYGKIDVAMLPIGGHFTMNVQAAGLAASLINADVTIPIHYNTWPPIEADPSQLSSSHSGNIIILEPGQSTDLD